jgi:hypothetical protein
LAFESFHIFNFCDIFLCFDLCNVIFFFWGCNSSWFQFLLLQYFSSSWVFFIFIVCNTLYSFYCVFVAFYYIIGSSQLFPFVSIFTYISLLDVSFLGFYFLVLLHCRFDSFSSLFSFSNSSTCSVNVRSLLSQCKFVLVSFSRMDDIQLFVLVYFVTYIELLQKFL